MNNKTGLSPRAAGAAGFTALLFILDPSARAQAQAAAPPEDTGDKLQQVTVTAEKRTENLERTSISITAISGDEIAAQAKSTVDSVLRDVPGVQVQGLAQGSEIFIRGVGSSIDPGWADPSVALMVDGAYNGRTESVVSAGYDLTRVEVLRGPQGTLYGRNATGGSVNVITNNPALGRLEGTVRVQGGNYGEYRVEGAFNLPLGETVAVRVAGFDERHSDYIPDGGSDENARGGRVKVLWRPDDAFTILAKADVYQESGHGIGTVPVPGSDGNLVFPPFLPAFVPQGWVTPSSSPWSEDVWHPDGIVNRRSETFSLQADIDLGFGQLTVLPAYTKSRDAEYTGFLFGTIPPAGGYTWLTPAATYRSVEVHLASEGTSKVTWLLGAYYLRTNSDVLGSQAIAAGDGSAFDASQQYQPGSTLAFFGQSTYPIVDRLRVVAGLRWSRDTQGESFQITNQTDNYDSGVTSYSDARSSTTYKAGIELDLARESMLYASVSTGFKQGGLSAAIPPVVFQPETLRSIEIGEKSRFFSDTLQVNAAVFDYDYRNYQLTAFVAEPLANTDATYNAPVIYNADTSRIRGGEIEIDWLATRSDELRGSVSGLHTRYGNVVIAANPFAGPDAHQLGGRQMANAPDLTASLSYQHSWNVGPGQLMAGADIRYSSSYYATPEYYLPGAYQGSYHVSNATLRYAALNGRWSIGAYVKNIENDAQTTYVFPGYRRFVTAPRTFGASADVHF